jgi:hypothetical protein
MGLNYYTAREVLRAREHGSLGAVATIGRLTQYLQHSQVAALARRYQLSSGAWSQQPYGGYCEPFLTAAGAESVSSIDASAYEGADIVHDMNTRIGPQLECRFDVVIDGGSIEHIFRPDRALENLMRMTKVGGRALIWAPANNQCGHGFFQFSPEFFYSALDAPRGFSIERMLLVECVYPSVSLVAPRRAYAVRGPKDVRERVGAMSRRPLMLLVHARKLSHVDSPFDLAPQQSDYAAQWAADQRHGASRASLTAELSQAVQRRALGAALIHHAHGLRERRRLSLRNTRFFTRQRD